MHSRRSPAQKLERIWRQLAKPPKSRSKTAELTRRATLARATPVWADFQTMYRMYMAA
jgi:hypothetical protein